MSTGILRPVIESPGPGTDPVGLYTRLANVVNQLIVRIGTGGPGTVTHSTTALTANHVVLGNGGSDEKILASLGTTTTVLHGNAAGSPSFAAVSLTADVSGVLPVANGGLLAAAANVATSETQTSGAAYGDLATVGPTVTLTTRTSVIIWMSAIAFKSFSFFTGHISVDVSGATTIAASDANGVDFGSPIANGDAPMARVLALSGLTAGSNTFTLKYRNDGGGTWNFYSRSIAVLAL